VIDEVARSVRNRRTCFGPTAPVARPSLPYPLAVFVAPLTAGQTTFAPLKLTLDPSEVLPKLDLQMLQRDSLQVEIAGYEQLSGNPSPTLVDDYSFGSATLSQDTTANATGAQELVLQYGKVQESHDGVTTAWDALTETNGYSGRNHRTELSALLLPSQLICLDEVCVSAPRSLRFLRPRSLASNSIRRRQQRASAPPLPPPCAEQLAIAAQSRAHPRRAG
jgi:hypothetical protein